MTEFRGKKMKKESLSDKEICLGDDYCIGRKGFETKDVKEKVQKVQRRLKEELGYGFSKIQMKYITENIDKILKEEFGEKLI